MADKFKITYFDAKGWAEPARMILSYGGAAFEDIRFKEMPADVKASAPYGQVPLLEYNGQVISQSAAITRFLARKFKLVGANDLEAAKCDELADAVKDMAMLWRSVLTETEEAKKLEAAQKAAVESKTRFLSKFNEIATANGGHLVGKSLTWADIVVTYMVSNIETRSKIPFTDEFPALKALTETVNNTPGIKEWIAKRPVTEN